MQPVIRILPAISVLLLAVAGVVPWGHGNDLRFCLPALPFMAIYYWQDEQPALVPVLFVTFVGLAIDILTSGPLGYWAFVFLVGVAMSWGLDGLLGGDGLLRWVGFILASAGVSCAAWVVASAYVVQPVAWRPMVLSVVIQTALYPVLALLLRPVARAISGPRILVLERQR